MVLLLIFTICILLSIFFINKLMNYETFVSEVEEIEDVELEKKDTENSFQNDSGNTTVNTDKELVDSDTLLLIDERRKQGELFSEAIILPGGESPGPKYEYKINSLVLLPSYIICILF